MQRMAWTATQDASVRPTVTDSKEEVSQKKFD